MKFRARRHQRTVSRMRLDPAQFQRQVGRRIAQLRREAGLTQAKLAERLGMAIPNVQRIERGAQNVTVQTIARLAGALRVAPLKLLEPPDDGPAQPVRRTTKR